MSVVDRAPSPLKDENAYSSPRALVQYTRPPTRPDATELWIRFGAVTTLIVLAAAARLLPHPPNFAPIAAIALFAGAHLRNRLLAVLLPLAAMIVSDLFLPRDSLTMRACVYGSFLAILGLGMIAGRFRRRPLAFVGATAMSTLAGSLLFFAVTNFAVWQLWGMYPRTIAGLGACYAAGIPFFRYTLAGDVFYVAVLFGGFALIGYLVRVTRRRFAPAPSVEC